MNAHRYSVTVQELTGPQGQPPAAVAPIHFEASSHDDLHEIVARASRIEGFDAATAASFAVGLKLFSGVMLERRNDPLFADFAPHFGQFMRTLKSRSRDAR